MEFPRRQRHMAISTETWKEMAESLPKRLVSDKQYHILPLLFTLPRRASFFHTQEVIWAFWCTMALRPSATVVQSCYPWLIAFADAPQLILQESLVNAPWAAIQPGQHLLEEADFCLLWPSAKTACFLIQVHPHVQSSRVPRLCEQLVTWYVWLPQLY